MDQIRLLMNFFLLHPAVFHHLVLTGKMNFISAALTGIFID